MLHVAAQGDQAYSLTYFKDCGLSIRSKDKEKSTPLHWACCAGSDTASYYLQSWGVDVNAKDFLGYTPLHLAVRYSARFPNTRAIKELLIKGADRDAVEKSGLRPIDLVESLEDTETKEELRQLLKKPTFLLPCCHFRQPMVKLERNNKTVALFLTLMLGTFFLSSVFVYPCKLLSKSLIPHFYRHLLHRMVPNQCLSFLGSYGLFQSNPEDAPWLYERHLKCAIRQIGRKVRS